MHGETRLKMGWVLKKYNFSFSTALNWSNCILMVSLYIWLLIYTNNETLTWKFDLSSWEILGRIYALSIEVLSRGRSPSLQEETHGEIWDLILLSNLSATPPPHSSLISSYWFKNVVINLLGIWYDNLWFCEQNYLSRSPFLLYYFCFCLDTVTVM